MAPLPGPDTSNTGAAKAASTLWSLPAPAFDHLPVLSCLMLVILSTAIKTMADTELKNIKRGMISLKGCLISMTAGFNKQSPHTKLSSSLLLATAMGKAADRC